MVKPICQDDILRNFEKIDKIQRDSFVYSVVMNNTNMARDTFVFKNFKAEINVNIKDKLNTYLILSDEKSILDLIKDVKRLLCLMLIDPQLVH